MMERDSQFETDVSEMVHDAIKQAAKEVKIENVAKILVEEVKRKALANVYVNDVIIPGALAKMVAETRGVAGRTKEDDSVQEKGERFTSDEQTGPRRGTESKRSVSEKEVSSKSDDVIAERSMVNAGSVNTIVRDAMKDLLKEVVHMVNESELKSEDLKSHEAQRGDEHHGTGTVVNSDSAVKTSKGISRNMGGDNMSSVEIYFSVKETHTNFGNTNLIYSKTRKIKSGSDIGGSQAVNGKHAHSTVSAHLDENDVLPEYYLYFTQQSTSKESRLQQRTESQVEDVIDKTKKQSRWNRRLHNAVGYVRNLFRCHRRSAKMSRAEAYMV